MRLALLDLGEALYEGDGRVPDVAKARYIADCIDKMLRAKIAWAREWAHYQPMVEEEFGV